MNPSLREVLCFSIWLPFALPVGVIYGAFLIHVMDRNLGMAGGAVVIVFPAAILLFAIVAWLPVWSYLRLRLHRRLGWFSLIIAVVLMTGFVFIVCGTNCFSSAGPNPFLAYFVVPLVAMAAFLHDRMSRAWLVRPGETA